MRIKIGGKNNEKTTIILNMVLDASGSMEQRRNAVIDGFNEYVQTVKAKNEGSDFVVNVVSFNWKTEYLYTGVDLAELPKMSKAQYNPDGGTALYDAVADSIYQADVTKRLLGNATVLTMIFTDGQENSSCRFKGDAVKKMIAEREATKDWTFTFIGADQACLDQAVSQLGIFLGNAVPYNPDQFIGTMNNMAMATNTYACNVSSGLRSSETFYKDAGFDTSKNLNEQMKDGFLTVDELKAIVNTTAKP